MNSLNMIRVNKPEQFPTATDHKIFENDKGLNECELCGRTWKGIPRNKCCGVKIYYRGWNIPEGYVYGWLIKSDAEIIGAKVDRNHTFYAPIVKPEHAAFGGRKPKRGHKNRFINKDE